MSNNFSALLPTLIAEDTIEALKSRSGFLGKIFTETTQENTLKGGSSVTIPKPIGAFTPTDVSYASAATPQSVTIPSVTLNFNYHKEVKIAANMLESRVAQGNFGRILELVNDGIVDGLVSTIDASIAALYTSATNTAVGTPGVYITDAVLRSAAATLADKKVDIQRGNNVHLVVTPSDYYNGILGVDRYVTALNIGGTESIRGGKIPSLFNIGVDYSQNVAVTSSSPATNHNLMFEKYAFVIGFMEFEKANTYGEANAQEAIITDPQTGISLRVQKYYDAGVRTWYYQVDVKWGVEVLDANRFVEVKS